MLPSNVSSNNSKLRDFKHSKKASVLNCSFSIGGLRLAHSHLWINYTVKSPSSRNDSTGSQQPGAMPCSPISPPPMWSRKMTCQVSMKLWGVLRAIYNAVGTRSVDLSCGFLPNAKTNSKVHHDRICHEQIFINYARRITLQMMLPYCIVAVCVVAFMYSFHVCFLRSLNKLVQTRSGDHPRLSLVKGEK